MRVFAVILMGLLATSCMVKNKEIESGLSNKKMAVTQEIKGVFTPVASMYEFLDKLNTAADVSDIAGSGATTTAVIRKNIFKLSGEAQLVFDCLNMIELGDFTTDGKSFKLIYNVNAGEFDTSLNLASFDIEAAGTLSGDIITQMTIVLKYELDGEMINREIFYLAELNKEVDFYELLIGVTEIAQGTEFDIEQLSSIASYLLSEHVLNEYLYINFVTDAMAIEVGLVEDNPFSYDVPNRPYTLKFNKLHLVFDESGINFEQSDLDIEFVNIDTKDTVDFHIDGVYLDGEKVVSWNELVK